MPDFCCVSLLAGLPNRLLSACQPQCSRMLTSTLSRSHVIICEIQITAHSAPGFILKVLSFTAKHFVNQQTEPRRVSGLSSSLSRREGKMLPLGDSMDHCSSSVSPEGGAAAGGRTVD